MNEPTDLRSGLDALYVAARHEGRMMEFTETLAEALGVLVGESRHPQLVLGAVVGKLVTVADLHTEIAWRDALGVSIN
jgi:hypothetical protein